jgi:hypothetical protein
LINSGNSSLLPKNFSISRRNSILQVLLSTDEDCNEQQFSEAVAYYKANGFPHEGSYNDLFGTKSMQLLTDYGNSLSNEMTK